MVHHTRLDCAIGSAGGMRRALSVALNHTATRRAFGATLLEQVTKNTPLCFCASERRLEHLATVNHDLSLTLHYHRKLLHAPLSFFCSNLNRKTHTTNPSLYWYSP